MYLPDLEIALDSLHLDVKQFDIKFLNHIF